MSDDYYAKPENQVPAGPGRRRRSPRLTTHVPIRFSPDVIEVVKKLADTDRRTVSSWIRTVVDQEIERRTDETDTTAEQFDRIWEGGEPVETVGSYDWADDPNLNAEETMRIVESLGPGVTVTGPPDPSRKRLITVIAQAIWEHWFRKTGTAGSYLDISDDGLAAAIVDRFTCPECTFVDMFEGNDGGVCNDCAPRVTARKRLES
jgi:predicted transcriptional regulator